MIKFTFSSCGLALVQAEMVFDLGSVQHEDVCVAK